MFNSKRTAKLKKSQSQNQITFFILIYGLAIYFLNELKVDDHSIPIDPFFRITATVFYLIIISLPESEAVIPSGVETITL